MSRKGKKTKRPTKRQLRAARALPKTATRTSP